MRWVDQTTSEKNSEIEEEADKKVPHNLKNMTITLNMNLTVSVYTIQYGTYGHVYTRMYTYVCTRMDMFEHV